MVRCSRNLFSRGDINFCLPKFHLSEQFACIEQLAKSARVPFCLDWRQDRSLARGRPSAAELAADLSRLGCKIAPRPTSCKLQLASCSLKAKRAGGLSACAWQAGALTQESFERATDGRHDARLPSSSALGANQDCVRLAENVCACPNGLASLARSYTQVACYACCELASSSCARRARPRQIRWPPAQQASCETVLII